MRLRQRRLVFALVIGGTLLASALKAPLPFRGQNAQAAPPGELLERAASTFASAQAPGSAIKGIIDPTAPTTGQQAPLAPMAVDGLVDPLPPLPLPPQLELAPGPAPMSIVPLAPSGPKAVATPSPAPTAPWPPAPKPALMPVSATEPMEMPVAPPFSLAQCDVESSGPVCFDSGQSQQSLLPPALAPGLRGCWSFDKTSVVDSSEFQNHGFGSFQAGPAFGGQGTSAYFRATFLEVPDTSGSLQLRDFSYTFWVYLIEDGVAPLGFKVCPLLRKGLASSTDFVYGAASEQYGAAPAILFNRESRRLRIELVTTGVAGTEVGVNLAEAFESNAKLRKGRWFHIALVRSDENKRTRLYINGVLDASHSSRGYMKPAETALYIGGDPLTKDSCNFPLYIDELKVYSRSLDADDIQAEASPALAGIEPSFVRLGCISCPLEVAEQECPEGYHICSSLEMHMGGYQVAHSLGWLEQGGHIWTRRDGIGGERAGAVGGVPAPAPLGSGGGGGGAVGTGGGDALGVTSSPNMEVPGITSNAPGPSTMTVLGRVALAELLTKSIQSPTAALSFTSPHVGLGICCASSTSEDLPELNKLTLGADDGGRVAGAGAGAGIGAGAGGVAPPMASVAGGSPSYIPPTGVAAQGHMAVQAATADAGPYTTSAGMDVQATIV